VARSLTQGIFASKQVMNSLVAQTFHILKKVVVLQCSFDKVKVYLAEMHS
jgi:hypothetical protein